MHEKKHGVCTKLVEAFVQTNTGPGLFCLLVFTQPGCITSWLSVSLESMLALLFLRTCTNVKPFEFILELKPNLHSLFVQVWAGLAFISSQELVQCHVLGLGGG